MGGEGRGKRGGARIVYVYVVIAGRIYLLRCYAKNVRTDLTPEEKKQVRQIAAHLKGAQ
ncbi:MAG: type II toxin-antitoxin system RelE/ParE family toxin [Bryobacteraceae bacterium]|jgi:phage-related protein